MAQEFYPYDQPPRSEYDKMGGIAPGGGAIDALVRAYKVQMQRNAAGAQDAPVRPVDTTGVRPPAVTQNAVAIASEPVKATQPAAPPALDAAPKASAVAQPARNSNTVSGPVSGFAPNANVPYPGGESPAARAASFLPVAPSIQFNAPPQAVAQGAQGMRSNLGMISPEIDYEASTLLDEAKPLLRSKGIVDRLRGRQAMRMRSRLLADAANLAGVRVQGANAESGQLNAQSNMLGAQTGAFRASNEVPLALLQASTNRYGYDTQRYGIDSQADIARMRDATDRENNIRSNATIGRNAELGLLPHVGAVAQGERAMRAYAEGDDAAAERALTANRRDPADRLPTFQINQITGDVWYQTPQGPKRVIDPEIEARRNALLPRARQN